MHRSRRYAGTSTAKGKSIHSCSTEVFLLEKTGLKKEKNTSWDESDSDITKSNGENKLGKKN